MATSTPQVYGPDGVLRETVYFSTTSERRFFQGTATSDTVDVQVSINGGGYTSDPEFILFTGSEWTVPNPAADPNGLLLLTGINTVEVRAVLLSGSVTSAAKATVTLVDEATVGVIALTPTGVTVEQLDQAVRISVPQVDAVGLQGFNFYASLYAGGGATGYTRVNLNTVTTGVVTQTTTDFAEVLVNAEVLVDPLGNPVADPLYWRLTATQEDENEVVLQTDLNEAYEIPEVARKLRLSGTLSSVENVTVYSFEHNRLATPASTPPTISVGSFASALLETPLYYVVTAVYYNATQNLEYESAFSPEVVAHPLSVTTALGAFPATSRQDIVRSFITSVYRSNPQIKVEAGSVLRDTVIDPFSSEAERLRFVLDFFHRARTPTLLLQVDDPTGSGTSVSVPSSPYKIGLKTAFYLTSDSSVQALINSCFDAYASNFGVVRRTSTYAQGEVTFYTTTRPTSSLVIPLGTLVSGGGQQFSTTRAASIAFSQLASYFNPVTGRYQVTVPVRAVTPGPAGNVGAGQVRALVTRIPTLSVTNSAAMFGGNSTESNLALTERTLNALASVDSGTERGYYQTAAAVPGVESVAIVGAGNPLMQRDLYDGQHLGGKVDVWVQGESLATVTDTFSFTYEVAQDIQFVVAGDPANLTFQAIDPSLSATNPIIEVLDYPLAGYEFKNATTGEVFDLTGVTITSYNTVQLDTTLVQPSVTLTDVVLGSYRRRAGVDFVLPRQPVAAVTSVAGAASGTLPTTAYTLYRPNSPLAYGRSTLAGDYLNISGYIDPTTGALVPSGEAIAVTNESHVLIGSYPEFLDNLGALYYTVEVWNADKTIQYKGPNDPSGDPDYTIDLGTQTTAVAITRTETGDIPNGATVLIDYAHDENFVVTYTTNLIVSVTQNAVDEKKHATADVLAKEAVIVPLDIEATLVLQQGQDRSTVDTTLRTNLANFFAQLRLGDAVRQSDIIGVMENTTGVSYVVVPLAKLVRQAGSQVVQEALSTDVAYDSTLLTSLTTSSALVYIVNQELSAATVDGGGAKGDYKGVFQDEVELDLLASDALLTSLGTVAGRAYILGSEGRSITGFSDDATLIAEGYTTNSQITARRLELTANRVLVSLAIGDSPTAHTYAVTYIVGVDKGAKDIDPGEAEYLTLGALTFTYDETRP